uniref:ATP synthase peripheral stalk subunit F6, mitochondrial n=1 Tax=Oryzias melastigma TaxID=30732 RepID=A0A3B3CED6_ORYME
MAAALLRTGRLIRIRCLQAQSCVGLVRTSASFSTKSGGSNKPTKKNRPAQLDPIQKLFLDSIRQYSSESRASGGLLDAGEDYQKTLAEEVAKLQRLYGGGDLESFPEFSFPEPRLDEGSQK